MSILKGLLENEDLLIGLGLLSGGSQGQGIGQAGLNSVLQAAQIKKAFAPKKRNIVKGADGYNYYENGERVLPGVEKEVKKPQRKTIQGADGYQYFVDTGERALPDVEKEVKPTQRKIIKGADGYQRYVDTGERVFANVKQIPKDTRTSLQKNLESAGIYPGDPRYEEAILAGTSQTAQGLENTSPLMSKNAIDDSLQGARYSSRGMDKIINIANLTSNSPEVFGVKGKVLGFGSGVQKELQGMFQNDLTNMGVIDKGAMELLSNPDFSRIGAIEDSLSINLARSRNPQDRLMKDMIIDAKQNTKLTGLGGVKAVREKLSTLFKEFEDTTRDQYELAGYEDDQINAIINQKRKEFNNAMKNLSDKKSNKPKIPRFTVVNGRVVPIEEE